MLEKCFKVMGVKEVYTLEGGQVTKYVKEGESFRVSCIYIVNEGACNCSATGRCKHLKMLEGSYKGEGIAPGFVVETIEAITGECKEELLHFASDIRSVKLQSQLKVDAVIFLSHRKSFGSFVIYFIKNGTHTTLLEEEEVL